MKLMAVTNGYQEINELTKSIIQIHPFVDYIQIREKRRSAGELYQLGKRLINEGVPKEKLLMNDRMDIALLLQLQQLHLPGNGLPLEHVKGTYPNLDCGISVHTLDEAITAEKHGATYMLYGHCFPTDSKKGKEPIPLSSIRNIKRSASIPLYVIGGINEVRIEQVASYGADGVAVMSAIFASRNPAEAAKRLKERCAYVKNQSH
ncbi:thiamine phosphate synthase [Cytobacillus gottheilii]|uniref:thiamine phosphate synthase n=1 Tax=Cytobacillus gottheilii TaxID=859144 RepID=UPI0009BB358F|nr:thiamine phosphate synthase [Cytobacillus gottheilii]